MAECILETEKMLVYQAQLGDWDNLNHLLVCKKTKKAVIIDPFFSNYWLDVCSHNGWNLEQVWLTHSHWDHSKGVEGLQDRLVWVHKKRITTRMGRPLKSRMVNGRKYLHKSQVR